MPVNREDMSREDTFRAGTKTNNRMTHIRTPEMVAEGKYARADVETFTESAVTQVKGLSGGLSLFNQTSSSRPWWYRVPKQKLPVGLVFQWRGPTEGLPVPGTHYQIEPLVDMPLTHYLKLLGDIQVDERPVSG